MQIQSTPVKDSSAPDRAEFRKQVRKVLKTLNDCVSELLQVIESSREECNRKISQVKKWEEDMIGEYSHSRDQQWEPIFPILLERLKSTTFEHDFAWVSYRNTAFCSHCSRKTCTQLMKD